MQWIQDLSQSNVGNLNNIRPDASRQFRNKKKAYLKAKIKELETNSNIKITWDLYKCISDFKIGYRPRTNIVNVGKHDLFADYQSFRYVEELFLPAIECTCG